MGSLAGQGRDSEDFKKVAQGNLIRIQGTVGGSFGETLVDQKLSAIDDISGSDNLNLEDCCWLILTGSKPFSSANEQLKKEG